MRGLPGRDTQYSGSDCHRYVDALIRGAGDLDVVSPYIGRGYASMLAGHAGRHRVRVITSAAGRGGDAMRALGGRGGGWTRTALFLAALCAISAVIGLWYAFAVLAAMTALSAAAAALSRSRGGRNLRVKVSRKVFVHEKLYICGEAAISGSANLTFNGTHRNLEHIEVVVSPAKVAEMQRHFDGLWASL